MNKSEYELAKQEIITRLGQPEFDMSEPVNDSAKEIKELRSRYRSGIMTGRKRLSLTPKEEKEVVEEAKYTKAVPIHLNEDDLIVFKPAERILLMSYFENTDLSPKDLSRMYPEFSISKIVALLHSGYFKRLAGKMFEQTLPVKLQWALLKLVEAKNPKIVERMSEHFGLLKSQETTLNVNKPIDDPATVAKLKQIGDQQAND